jgi:hypothetical protein
MYPLYMNKNSQKVAQIFECNKCYYHTSRFNDYNKHLMTLKHKKILNGTKMIHKKSHNYICDICNRSYKYHTGLARHRNKTHPEHILKNDNLDTQNIKIDVDSDKDQNTNDAILLLTHALNKQGEQIDKLIQSQNEMIPRIGNNNNNISINVFLNNKCKDAINLDDFVKKINVTVDDLMNTRELGYTQGITNIFIKGLNEMDTTKRPIHCSDKKRLKFYVKDGEWLKDDGEKIDNAINHISRKQISQIKEWEKQNENWDKCEQKTSEYLEIIKQVMGGTTDYEVEKNRKDIVKNIGLNTFFKQNN